MDKAEYEKQQNRVKRAGQIEQSLTLLLQDIDGLKANEGSRNQAVNYLCNSLSFNPSTEHIRTLLIKFLEEQADQLRHEFSIL